MERNSRQPTSNRFRHHAQGASGGGKAKQQQRGSTGHSSKGGQRGNEVGKEAAARASDSKATDAVTAYRQQALIIVRLLAKLRKRGVQVPAILKKMRFVVDDLKPADPKDTPPPTLCVMTSS